MLFTNIKHIHLQTLTHVTNRSFTDRNHSEINLSFKPVFLQWNTHEEILRNVPVFSVHMMKVSGSRVFRFPKFSKIHLFIYQIVNFQNIRRYEESEWWLNCLIKCTHQGWICRFYFMLFSVLSDDDLFFLYAVGVQDIIQNDEGTRCIQSSWLPVHFTVHF